RFGWEARPSFSVSQNYDRAEVLYIFRDLWGVGSIRPDRSDKTLKFEVRSIEDLFLKVIPHFRQFPLMSSKQKDFEFFCEICESIYRKEHLTRDGFYRITQLALKMNPSGKRRYLASDFLAETI